MKKTDCSAVSSPESTSCVVWRMQGGSRRAAGCSLGLQLPVAVLAAGTEVVVDMEVAWGPAGIAAGQPGGGGVCGLPAQVPVGFCSLQARCHPCVSLLCPRSKLERAGLPPCHPTGRKMKSGTHRLQGHPVIAGVGWASSPLPPEPPQLFQPWRDRGSSHAPSPQPHLPVQPWPGPAAVVAASAGLSLKHAGETQPQDPRVSSFV